MPTHFAFPSATSPNNPAPLSPEAQASALWTYVHLKAPRFTVDTALEVIQDLHMTPGEDPKALARRLAKALRARGVAFKHTHALQAASRLGGHPSWYKNEDAKACRLEFETMDTGQVINKEYSSWRELGSALRDWVDRLQARGQLPLGVLTLSFTRGVLWFTTPIPRQEGKTPSNEVWPLGGVMPKGDVATWLEEAPAALEKLRRHLEENGTAVLDGYAVLQLCAGKSSSLGQFPGVVPVRAADAINSELVLMREDNEDDPRGGYEIARGDELTCWHQLELAVRDERHAHETPAAPLSITVPVEGVGAWFVNGVRYIWALETLRPDDYVPGRVFAQLGIPDCERLARRYKLAKRIHEQGFKHHDASKRVDYLSGVAEAYRVDLHQVLRWLREAGLDWAGYLAKYDLPEEGLRNSMPTGVLFQFLENLKIEDPNKVFAMPTFSEMARVRDAGFLRALMPRVDAVRCVMPRDVEEITRTALLEAAEEFNSSLRVQKFLSAGAITQSHETPHLVYASDAEQLRSTVDELGFDLYAAAVPHLVTMKGVVPLVPENKTWPWAVGHALFFRFERQGVSR